MLNGIHKALVICLTLILLLSLTVTASNQAREIVINIPEFTLYLYENDIELRKYEIGVGHQVQPSVIGKTEVINLVVDPTFYPTLWWERGVEPVPPGPDNPVGTRWIGLGFPSYGIHGTNEPDSIGRAVSAGCIRMHNEDVEELMGLISIGTPVSIWYETVKLTHDPEINTEMITVYPDIYRLGTNTLANVQRLATNFNWEDVHLPVLEILLNSASGKPYPMPLSVSIAEGTKETEEVEETQALSPASPEAYLNDQWLGLVLIDAKGENYLPFNPIVDLIDAPVEYFPDQEVLYFHQTHGVKVLTDNEIIYVPEWVIKWMIPGARLVINYP